MNHTDLVKELCKDDGIYCAFLISEKEARGSNLYPVIDSKFFIQCEWKQKYNQEAKFGV